MEVRSITIGGFKNIEKTKVEIKKITALVSLNNYGKTNFLMGVDFGLDYLKRGEFERKRMMGLPRYIPLNPILDNDPFFFEIELHEPKLKEYQFVRYGFSFKWKRDDDSGQRLVDEWLDLRESESTKYTGYLKRGEGKYRKSKTTNAFRNINLSDYQLALDNLSSVDDLDYLEALRVIREFSFKTCSLLDMEKSYKQTLLEFDSEDLMTQADNDIPKSLYHLEKNEPKQFELFKESVLTLFDDISDFHVVKTDLNLDKYMINTYSLSKQTGDSNESVPFKLKSEIYKIFVVSKYINQPIEITMLSAGTKRLFWILATIFISGSSSNLIAIEELETSIHPNLLKKTLEIIYEYLGESKLIITSHSPYLIQYLNLENIYVALPNSEGRATFRNILKGKVRSVINGARDNGLSVGEYLFELMGNNSKSIFNLKFLIEC
ncbi:MAG: ATP-binding protein [Balneolaceae bacterium]